MPEIVTANSPVPSWYRNMEYRRYNLTPAPLLFHSYPLFSLLRLLYAEDPTKNKDDDTSALQLVQKYRTEFPTVDKWRKGLLPPGRNPSTHPSCASAGVVLQIPWLQDIVREVQVADRKRKREEAERAEKAKQLM